MVLLRVPILPLQHGASKSWLGICSALDGLMCLPMAAHRCSIPTARCHSITRRACWLRRVSYHACSSLSKRYGMGAEWLCYVCTPCQAGPKTQKETHSICLPIQESFGTSVYGSARSIGLCMQLSLIWRPQGSVIVRIKDHYWSPPEVPEAVLCARPWLWHALETDVNLCSR